jgi:hypothetical protein
MRSFAILSDADAGGRLEERFHQGLSTSRRSRRQKTGRNLSAARRHRAASGIYEAGARLQLQPIPDFTLSSGRLSASIAPATQRRRPNFHLIMPFAQPTLTPPPMARTRTARNSLGTTYPLNPVHISTQPPPRPMMSASARALPSDHREQAVDDGTLRLRGGCIPCPVRLFPLIALQITSAHVRTIIMSRPWGGGAMSSLFFRVPKRSALTTCSYDV